MTSPKEWLNRAQHQWEGGSSEDASTASLAAAATGLLAAVVETMDADERIESYRSDALAYEENWRNVDQFVTELKEFLDTMTGTSSKVKVSWVIERLEEALKGPREQT